MKTFKFMLVALTLIVWVIPGCAQTTDKKQTKSVLSNATVEVYYFHYTRRCATCQAVERVTQSALEGIDEEKVVFQSVNLDESEGKAKGKEMEVYGQALILVSGDNKVDVTSEAFMNARSNPEKLKSILKEKIEAFL